MSQVDSMVRGFLNSADLQAHFEELHYRFTMPEAAFIVFRSRHRTLVDKVAAWRTIAIAYPNCGMCARVCMKPIPDFREFLEECANEQEYMLRSFTNQRSNASARAGYGYSYEAVSSLRYADGKEHLYESTIDQTNVLFPSFDDCMKAIAEELRDEAGFLSLTVTRYEYDAEADKTIPRTTVAYDPNLNVISIWSESEGDDIADQFEGMCFKFPLPFKRGDILADCCPGLDKRPFVLDQIKLWNVEEMRENGLFACGVSDEDAERIEKRLSQRLIRAECMEMGAYVIEASDCYGLYEDPLPLNNALDFERFRGELPNECKILRPVSEFLHGECSVELLVNACVLLSMEAACREREQALGQEYERGYLERLGIPYGENSGASQR